MKFFTKNLLRRSRSNRIPCENSNINLSPVTYGAIQIWTTLPSMIRNDPALASFRAQYEHIPSGNLRRDTRNSSSNDESFFTGYATSNGSFSTDSEQMEQSPKIEDNNRTSSPLVDMSVEAKNVNKPKLSRSKLVLKSIKIALFVAIWILFTSILMAKDEKLLTSKVVSVPPNGLEKNYALDGMPVEPRIGISLYGAFADEDSNTTNFLLMHVRLFHSMNESSSAYTETDNDSDVLKLPIVKDVSDIDSVHQVRRTHIFRFDSTFFEQIKQTGTILQLDLSSNLPVGFPIQLEYDPTPIDKSLGVIYAAIILLGLYAMIITELVDRVFAGMVASTMSIAVLAYMNDRPTMQEIVSWIDFETLLLLFGMMTIVAILSETGIFDYLAVYAFKITKGNTWPLINCLCLFTAILSAFLDNMTTILLITPVSFRLCEVMKLNPVPILMSMIIFSNTGGALTPIGDPPNIIIASNPSVVKSGVNFLVFSSHMSVGIFLVMIQTYIHLRYKFRSLSDLHLGDPHGVQEIREELASWEHAASRLSSTSNDEHVVRDRLQRKIHQLQQQLKKRLSSGKIPTSIYEITLTELQQKYPIKKPVLLVKCGVAMAFVLICFFSHSLPYFKRLSLGWTALLGAILLLILTDRKCIESILVHIEWSMLLFFAVLFVLMESLARLGLIEWIGNQTENIVMSVNEEFRLTVAILLILWVSALVSAFVDNIPLTTMMIRIAISLTEKKALSLPLQPLAWALAFGACLGGNGTVIGAAANIVGVSVAKQYGYRIGFFEFFKIAFPVMIGSIVIASGYLILSHVSYTWH